MSSQRLLGMHGGPASRRVSLSCSAVPSRQASVQAALLSAYATLGERTGGRPLAALAAKAQTLLPRFSGHELAGMARALVAADAQVPVSLCFRLG